MKLGDFRALTFDCYGTLIDWETGLLAALRPWAESKGLHHEDREILEAFAALEPVHEERNPATPYPEILELVFHDLARAWGVATEAGAARAFAASVGGWPPFADTVESLAYLKRHFRLVVLSNVDRASFARTNRLLGIEFDAVVTAQDVGCYKPDPAMFEALIEAAGKLDVGPAEILHTAQSLYHLIVPARAHGLRTLWVNRRGRAAGGATPAPDSKARPDAIVSSLAEAVELHRSGRELPGNGV